MTRPPRCPAVWASVRLGLVAMVLAIATTRGHAVILMGTGDPTANTTAPTGELEGSGWQWIGTLGSFCGTPIGPSTFLTAAHVGGEPGESFRYAGRTYRTLSTTGDPASDLAVWHVSGEFPSHAEIDRAEVAPGDGIVVFGKGGRRGAEVNVVRNGIPELSGWRWGLADEQLRWGTNTVDELVDGKDIGLYGPVFRAGFDRGAGRDECQVSVGDSGAPVFVKRPEGWRLAGINFATEAQFRTTASGGSFLAALFDVGGLFYQTGPNQWSEIPTEASPQPTHFAVTRVGPRAAWIDKALATAPPPAQLEAAEEWGTPFHAVTPLVHDPVDRYFEIGAGPAFRVFRLRGAPGLRFRSIRVTGGTVRMDYD
ncbi:MAG: hypothetical protein DVB31_05060 [Verrucomicrobia bacterium]|nr:MAG: hypothetical protein DVB31_05060 [Verrucomicrobiota bacterium]